VTARPSELFDIVVIGGGPGGYATALYAAAAGLTVAVVEEDKVGGTCLHRGCIPTKELLETAALMRSVAGASDFGVLVGRPRLDLGAAMARKSDVVSGLHRGLTGLLQARKVSVLAGRGRLVGAGVVAVESAGGPTSLEGKAVVLATGSSPRPLPGLETDGRMILDSDHVLEWQDMPATVAVVGGGAIGCEFASMFADLGARVDLFEVADRLLPTLDADIGPFVRRAFERRGVRVHTGAVIGAHERTAGGVVLHGTGAAPLLVDRVVVSVGRSPRTAGLVAPEVAISTAPSGHVQVDEWMRTGVPGVFALGDLVATPQLAHVAFAEAILVVRQILGEPCRPVDYSQVPWCIYSHPEVASVGLSEDAARRAGHEVVVAREAFAGNGRARIIGDTEGMVKVVAERGADGSAGRLLGVHMVGPWVTEQIGQARATLGLEGVVSEVETLVQAHPSLSETYGEALLALGGRALHG
jgi:dihydrolipoamide dehydrogenase